MKNKRVGPILPALGLIALGILVAGRALFHWDFDDFCLIAAALFLAGLWLLLPAIRSAYMGEIPRRRAAGDIITALGTIAASCIGLLNIVYDWYGAGMYLSSIVGWLTVPLFLQALGSFISYGPRFGGICMGLYAIVGMVLFAYEWNVYGWFLSGEQFFAVLIAVALSSLGMTLLAKSRRKPGASPEDKRVRLFRGVVFGCFALQLVNLYMIQWNRIDWYYFERFSPIILIALLCVFVVIRLKRLEKRLLSALSKKESNSQET